MATMAKTNVHWIGLMIEWSILTVASEYFSPSNFPAKDVLLHDLCLVEKEV
jgi:hypothetical protein